MKWSMVPFSKVAEIVTGNTPPRKNPENYGPGVPWVKPPDLDGWEPISCTNETLSPMGQKIARLLPKKTVLVCCIGSIGRVGIAGTTLSTNQQINSLIFGPSVSPRFGYYYCRFIPQVFQAAARKAVVPILNKSNFAKIKMPLPPLSEQRRIVEILDQADALRKKRAEADAKAARILPSLFYKMFGDPATNPKGWPLYNLGDPQLAKINPRLIKQEISIDAEFSFVPMPDIDERWGRIIGKQSRPYSEVCRGFTYFQDGDVIFAKITPCMQNGKAAIVSNLKNGRGFGSTEFHVLRPGPLATPEWLFGLIRLNMFRKQAEASFTGSAGQQRVPLYFLKNYKIGCPPKELQQRFSSSVHRIFQHVDEIETSENKLLQLFKWLLHSAFTGGLTAKWREAHRKELLAEMEEQTKVL